MVVETHLCTEGQNPISRKIYKKKTENKSNDSTKCVIPPKAETLITKEVSQFIHLVTWVAVSMGMFFFIIAFLLEYYWIDAILFLIGVIVANVPEGLLAVVTISLSLSAKRLSSR